MLAFALLLGGPALAQCPQQSGPVTVALGDQTKAATALRLCVGEVVTVVTQGKIGTVIVGDPGVVATNVLSSTRLSLTALRLGDTSLVLMAPGAETGATVNLSVFAAPQGQAIQAPSQAATTPEGKTNVLIYRGAQWEVIECETDCIER